mgnify:FL=1
MKKTISFLLIALLTLAVVSPAIAADAEYTTREAWRIGVVTAIFDNAVAFVGDITVASNATVTGTTIVNAIDADGAADIDIGSADVTDVTIVTDGGTVILDGDVTCDKIIFTDAAVAAPTNTASQGFTITVNGTNYVIALYPN